MEASLPQITHKDGSTSAGAESHFIVGVSRSMKGFERLIRELADTDVPVLLMSEPGAGKRATAEHIHQVSARRQHPFVILEAGQLTREAFDDKAFFRTSSNGGTLYIDEVADLTVESQDALLSCLAKEEDEGTYLQCARLICGTSRDLEAAVREGRFREDLHYRISGLSLRLPPLRQRKEDIPHLLTFFLEKYAAELRCPIPSLSAETQRLFLEYGWPRTLRELDEAARVIVSMGDEALAMGGLRSVLARSDTSNGKRVSLKDAAKAASREAEKELILQVLTRTRWNRRRAAEELQISYKALLYKLKQIGYGNSAGRPELLRRHYED